MAASDRTERRCLQIAILRQMAEKGQLLEQVRRDMPQHYQAILRHQRITSSEADDYIEVFHNIKIIDFAEQCDCELDRTFTTPKEALKVLKILRNKRH